jgi:hypothetical protein
MKVFEKRVLRRMFGQKWDETVRGWRKLHNEELHNLYFSTYINGMIKSRSVRWDDALERQGRTMAR